LTQALNRSENCLSPGRSNRYTFVSTLRRVCYLTALALAFIAGIACVALIWRIGIAHLSHTVSWATVQIALGAATLALSWRFARRHHHRWVEPVTRLREVIIEIIAGETPIAVLSEFDGPLEPLAKAVQDIIRELRRQEQAKAHLHLELSERVRSRTDHLERKIASWQTQASRDSLTGLYNRRLLDEQLPEILDDCVARGSSLSVMLIDLDNFKLLNDTLGHDVGDKLLRDWGQLIRSTIRENDLAFRTGGDEFVIVLPGVGRPGANQLADRLVSLMDQLARLLKVPVKPGASIGISAPADLSKITATDLLRHADSAMYENKSIRKAANTRAA
jgi:diguanylate cyclase (GGDEF)-like protein